MASDGRDSLSSIGHGVPKSKAAGSGFFFRQTRSYPGGGLYKRLDHVRLVLQLHDELIYEVRKEDLDSISIIVKECMECAINLCVPLEIKLKSGPTWGSLSDYTIPSQQEPSLAVIATPVPVVVSTGGKTISISRSEINRDSSIPSLNVNRNIFGRDY
jgi:hypothetical protein